MEPTLQPEYRSPIARLGTFLRDFLPEQNLQLLFPLGSFLLLLGASHFWYRIQLPGVFEVLQQRNFQVDPQAFQQFNHSYTVWVLIEEQIAKALTRLAFFTSLMLWCLNFRKVVSKFLLWVFLPAGFALVAFQIFLIVTGHQRNALLDAFTSATQVPLPSTRPWFPSVGDGTYLTAGGLMVLTVVLILVRQRTISLPLRFRNAAQLNASGQAEMHRDGKHVFVLLIVMFVLPELFIPHPLPSVLIVYAIAFFEEFALRGYLQSTLERHFSLKRAIFVTGILWSLLPLGLGMTHSLLEAKAYFRIPGLSYLILLAGLIVYSVPLGWLYARTRSVLAVTLMHGTIALFHVGMGYQILLDHPEFYWMEMALWIFVGWYLFKKYPLESTESPREPEVSPA